MMQLGMSILDEEELVEEMTSWPPRACPFALRCTREDRSVRQWRGAVCMYACVCVSDMSSDASARAALCDIDSAWDTCAHSYTC